MYLKISFFLSVGNTTVVKKKKKKKKLGKRSVVSKPGIKTADKEIIGKKFYLILRLTPNSLKQ